MEHRHHARVPVGLDMLIYRRGLPVATGRIRNACRGGIFIETEYRELREHQNLEFEFRSLDQSGSMRHRVAGHVLRCTPEGVALEIDDADPGAPGAMVSLLGSPMLSSHGTEALEIAD